MSDCSYVNSVSLWISFGKLRCVLTIANFVNTMETIERGKLLRRHMSNYSYVMAETSACPSWLGGWFRGTRARERAAWRVPDLNEFAMGVGQWLTTCITSVCREKRCQLFENCANFACVQFSQSLIFATIGGFVRLNIRFASLTRRAFVAGAPNQFAP